MCPSGLISTLGMSSRHSSRMVSQGYPLTAPPNPDRCESSAESAGGSRLGRDLVHTVDDHDLWKGRTTISTIRLAGVRGSMGLMYSRYSRLPRTSASTFV